MRRPTMSTRSFLEERAGALKLIVIVILAIAVFAVAFQLKGEPGTGTERALDKAWFTIDDGRTWFADDARKCAPFEVQGKTAYRVYVFTHDGGRTRFAGFLERYTPDAKKALEELEDSPSKGDRKRTGKASMGSLRDAVETSGKEVKTPKTGDAGWTKIADPKAIEIVTVKAPDGSAAQLEPVSP
jgi:hypothetical protein